MVMAFNTVHRKWHRNGGDDLGKLASIIRSAAGRAALSGKL
jgi:hypothetical protein